MNYHQQRKKGVKFIAILIFVIALLAIIWLRPAIPDQIKNIAHTIGTPLWDIKIRAKRELSNIYSFFISKQKLSEHNKILEIEIMRLQALSYQAQVLREENKTLKELFKRDYNKSYILSEILAGPSETPYDKLIIDAGYENGINSGAYVTALGSAVIGKITDVFKNTAVVTLFSSPGVETNVLIGKQKIRVSAIGKGGGNFEARLPRDIEVFEGEVVTLPGEGEVVFSVIEHIFSNQTDPFKTLFFQNPFNIQEIQYVEVLL